MDWKRAFTWGGGYPIAVAGVLLVTLVLLPFRGLLPAATIMLLVVPAIIVVARFAGSRPAGVASVVAFLALDLLFIPPYLQLTVADYQEWIALLVFLTVALITGQQTAQLRNRERSALDRQRELQFLNDLSFRIVTADSTEGTADFIVRRVTDVLGADRVALYAPAASGVVCLASAGEGEAAPDESRFVQWVFDNSKAIGLPSPEGGLPAPTSVGRRVPFSDAVAEGTYLPLQTAHSLEGVLHVVADGATQDPSNSRLLVAAANLAAAALERQRLEEDAARSEALREADRLKSTLVSSVSHELKTPLAAATARVTGLIEEAGEGDAVRLTEELFAVSEDLGRLNDSIGDLLDLSRLESDAWRPHPEEHEIRDILGTMLSRFPAEMQARVRFDLPDELPPVCVDFAQVVRAEFNLVENALAYSSSGSVVTVGAEMRTGELVTWVADEGPGVADEEKPWVFDKFFRGSSASLVPSGTGLGLAISREIFRNNGGRVWLEDVEPHGARFLAALPLVDGEERVS